jgi:hypothetical protein
MTDEELQEMIDEADRDGDGEVSSFALSPTGRIAKYAFFRVWVSVQKRPLTSFQIHTHMYYIIDLECEYARGTDSCSKPASCGTSLTLRRAFISPSNQVSEEEFIRIMKKTSLY